MSSQSHSGRRAKVAGLLAAVAAAVGMAVGVPAHAQALPCLGSGSADLFCPRPQLSAFPGQQINSGNSRCSVGVTGDIAGRRYAVTAGHCYKPGMTVTDRGGTRLGRYEFGVPDHTGTDEFGFGVIRLSDNVNTSASLGGQSLESINFNPQVGQELCKVGSTTGRTCGRITQVTPRHIYADLYGDHGDSGGVVYTITPTGQAAFVGIVIAKFERRVGLIIEPASVLLNTINRHSTDGPFRIHTR
ncbi:MAG: hypothetical protein HOQ24_06190 [Mycobacteriaceae bacterium]|nr:hypothetical protein [Mycobacteriaceae bacterium]